MSSPPANLESERAFYEEVVAAMTFADPSELVYGFRGPRAHRRSPKELAALWRDAATTASDTAVWNMYIHVPYCKSICSFCNYKRLQVSGKEALEDYVSFMENEARLFGHGLRAATFGALYVGGGTPSVLTAAHLERVFAAIHDNFSFHPGATKTFEYDPMIMTEDRFEVVRKFGFRRFSFGVQSVDAGVNTLHNRGPQSDYHVEKQFAMLGRTDGSATNIDFLLGLQGTTPEKMIDEISTTLERHRPGEVSLYFISPTANYVSQHFDGDYDRFEAFLRPFEELIPPAMLQTAARLDYVVRTSGKHAILMHSNDPHLAVRPEGREHSNFSYCDVVSQAHRPLYLLGLGDSARSRIFGRSAYVAEHGTHDRSPEGQRYLAVDTATEDEIFSYVAHQLRDSDILSLADFRSTFGQGIEALCGDQVAKLVALGVAALDEHELRLCTQVRRDRVRDLLFFFPEARRGELRTLPTELRQIGLPSTPPSRLSGDEVKELVRPYELGSTLPGGWTIEGIAATGVTLQSASPRSRVTVRLIEPAGRLECLRSTKRFDLQYIVEEGLVNDLELSAALIVLGLTIEANE